MSAVDLQKSVTRTYLSYDARNIEHYLSVFQALNPVDYARWPNDPWLSKTDQPWFDGKVDHSKDELVPLEPFHKNDQGSLWNSNACRDISRLGYGYEDLQPWRYRGPVIPPHLTIDPPPPPFDAPRYCSDIRKVIKEKYEWAVPQSEQVRRVGAKSQVFLAEPEKHPFKSTGLSETTFNEYVVRVLVDRYVDDGFTFSHLLSSI